MIDISPEDIRTLGYADGMAWAIVYIDSEIRHLEQNRPAPHHNRKNSEWMTKWNLLHRIRKRCDDARKDAHQAFDNATQ